MMKLVLVMCVLGATAFENLAEAQSRRGGPPTRSERSQMRGRNVPPPPVVIPQQRRAVLSPNLINDAANGLIRGCEVRLRVSGWANQLYVNGVFSGNFQAGAQDYQLSDAISNYIYRGQCSQRSAYEMQLIRNAYLIQDFASGRSRNCYVKLNVSGWANQLYVNGVFSGNFDSRTEEMKLRRAIVDLIMNRTCLY